MPAKRIILVVVDEQTRTAARRCLEANGHAVKLATTRQEALRALDRPVDLVLLDYRLPDGGGPALLRRIKREHPDVLVIVLGGDASVDSAVEAMRNGAYHYLVNPRGIDALMRTVAHALQTCRRRPDHSALRIAGGPLARIIGESAAMREVKQLLARIAHSPASTVLLTGETGTGKDLAAQSLHDNSDRHLGAFMNITCSALPATLLESELFGHERGAFTDAKGRKRGLIEHADGGTLFLDEVGELELSVQSKLLRFLEERAFRRLGGTDSLHANVRVVAATNIDLYQAVRKGHFREDLYYRLAVMPVHLPPLRAREGDIELLASVFVSGFNRELRRRVRGLTSRAHDRLERHSWPGNVRELRNTIERAMLLAPRDVLDVEDLPLLDRPQDASSWVELPAEGIDLRALEQTLLVQALRRCGGNQVRAAALLHISRDQIRYRIEKFGLRGVGRQDARSA